jgi:hypothetical protein
MLFFWVVTPCGSVGRYQRFGEAYCLHHQGWGCMFLRSIGIYIKVYTALQPRRPTSHLDRRENLRSQIFSSSHNCILSLWVSWCWQDWPGQEANVYQTVAAVPAHDESLQDRRASADVADHWEWLQRGELQWVQWRLVRAAVLSLPNVVTV